MITKFKIFEAANEGVPEVGDYITDSIDPIRIGIICAKNYEYWTVAYLDNTLVYFVDIENIKYWSKNKEDLEPYIIANKYNL